MSELEYKLIMQLARRALIPVLTSVLFLWAASVANACSSGLEAISVGPDFVSANLQGHISYLYDHTNKLTVRDIAKQFENGDFEPALRAFGAGFSNETVWFQFCINNSGAEARKLFLEIKPAYLDRVEIFVVGGNQSVRQNILPDHLLGDHLPIVERRTIATVMATDIKLQPGLTTIFMKVKTTGSLDFRGSLRSPEAMVTSGALQMFGFAALEGIMLFGAIANFLYWLRLKQRIHLAFSISLLTISMMIVTRYGLLPPELFAGEHAVDYVASSLVCLGYITLAWLFIEQLSARRTLPKIYKALLILMIFDAAVIPASWLGYYQLFAPFVILGSMAIIVLAVTGNVILAKRGVQGSKTAATGFIIAGLAAVATWLALLGILPFDFLSYHGYEVSIVALMIQMQISVARRAEQILEERDKARATALELAKGSEQRAIELAEKRTRELVEAKERAEIALANEREAQEEQIRFVDIISHQYRTPLTVISNSVATLVSKLASDDEEGSARLQRMQRAINRLAELVDVNLQRSRLDGLSVVPSKKVTRVKPMLEEAVSRARDVCAGREIELVMPPELDAFEIEVDSDMIGLALLNLIENAHKFSPPAEAVIVRVKVGDNEFHISVEDQGRGIPADEISKLQQKYYRASNSAGVTGVGLGLHIVSVAAKAHDGDLRIASQEGKGTAVTFSIPRRG